MYSAATSAYTTVNTGEMNKPQLTEDELEKLQEIHELVNLLLREMSVMPRNTSQPFAPMMAPAMPYMQPYYQLPWGGAFYLMPPGF